MSWASNLDTKRGRAVNPHTHKLWAELLGETIKKYEIVKEMTYGTDEIGCSGSTGQRERVMGTKCAGPQYQQIGGDHENITVIVTICADGTSIAPTLIFKGKGFQIHWKQENPADASYVLSLIYVWELTQYTGWDTRRKDGPMARLVQHGSRSLTVLRKPKRPVAIIFSWLMDTILITLRHF